MISKGPGMVNLGGLVQQRAVKRDWESTLRSWAAPPSQTERDRCDNAVRLIRAAIASHSILATMAVKVFAQGSYRANTNVAQDSDVDVTVCYQGAFFCDLFFGRRVPSGFVVGTGVCDVRGLQGDGRLGARPCLRARGRHAGQ